MAIIDPRLDGAERAEAKPLWQRLVWMAAIWLGSVAVLGAVAMGNGTNAETAIWKNQAWLSGADGWIRQNTSIEKFATLAVLLQIAA